MINKRSLYILAVLLTTISLDVHSNPNRPNARANAAKLSSTMDGAGNQRNPQPSAPLPVQPTGNTCLSKNLELLRIYNNQLTVLIIKIAEMAGEQNQNVALAQQLQSQLVVMVRASAIFFLDDKEPYAITTIAECSEGYALIGPQKDVCIQKLQRIAEANAAAERAKTVREWLEARVQELRTRIDQLETNCQK